MARKTCGSCKYYGKVEIVPGYKALGCNLHSYRVAPTASACEEHKPKKATKKGKGA